MYIQSIKNTYPARARQGFCCCVTATGGTTSDVSEYQLPLTSKRLDCLVCGRNDEGSDGAVIVELKQWEKCSPALGKRLVTTWVGGAEREVLHPSAQVGQYQLYLEDAHTAFYEGPSPVALRRAAMPDGSYTTSLEGGSGS